MINLTKGNFSYKRTTFIHQNTTSHMSTDITAYNNALLSADKEICDALMQLINKHLKSTESKVWHGHPVWFINGNPIVGYSKQKNDVCLLFWSGQSFDEPALLPEGKFKAAEARYTDVQQVNPGDIKRWLQKAATIQWDYKNIVKRKGVLERLV